MYFVEQLLVLSLHGWATDDVSPAAWGAAVRVPGGVRVKAGPGVTPSELWTMVVTIAVAPLLGGSVGVLPLRGIVVAVLRSQE